MIFVGYYITYSRGKWRPSWIWLGLGCLWVFIFCRKLCIGVLSINFFYEAIIARFLTFFILQGRNPLFTKKGVNFRNRDIWTKQRHIICSKTILVEIRGLQGESWDVPFFCYMWRLPLSIFIKLRLCALYWIRTQD